MERQLWVQIIDLLRHVGGPKKARCTFSEADIARVHFWAVLHDRPISWACDPGNWPIHERRRALPSCSTMSRRLRSRGVKTLLAGIENKVLCPAGEPPLVGILDGKPLVSSNHSKDRQAGYGHAARGQAKGYKMHTVRGGDGSVLTWRVAPMNVDERVMGRRLLRVVAVKRYILGDSQYDDKALFAICQERGLQLIAPRRYPGKGLGHRHQVAARLFCIELLENPRPFFGKALLDQRGDIERYFGNLTSFGGGLTNLPPWVRTHRRVLRWVQAKLILRALKQRSCQTGYVG